MKAILVSYYRKDGGKTVFVHTVKGTVSELAAYKAAQGANYRENVVSTEVPAVPKTATSAAIPAIPAVVEPLWFSTKAHCRKGQSVDLTITSNGSVVVDDLDRVIDQQFSFEDAKLAELAKLTARFEAQRNGILAATKAAMGE